MPGDTGGATGWPASPGPSTAPGAPVASPGHDARADHRRRARRHRTAPRRRCVISSRLHRTFGLGGAEIGVVIGIMPLASALAQVPMGLALDRFGRGARQPRCLVALAGTLVFGSAAGRSRSWPLPDRDRLRRGDHRDHAACHALGAARRFAGRGDDHRERQSARRAARDRAARRRPGAPGLDAGVRRDRPADGGHLRRCSWSWSATRRAIGCARATPRAAESLRGLRAILTDRNLRPLLIMGVCTIAPFACVGGLWAGPYLQDVHGLDREQASFVLLGLVTAYNLGARLWTARPRSRRAKAS